MILYSWDASAPGAEGGGVHGTEKRARSAAGAWLRASGGRSAVIEQVVPCATGGYARTGTALAGTRLPSGRIRWAPLPRTAP